MNDTILPKIPTVLVEKLKAIAADEAQAIKLRKRFVEALPDLHAALNPSEDRDISLESEPGLTDIYYHPVITTGTLYGGFQDMADISGSVKPVGFSLSGAVYCRSAEDVEEAKRILEASSRIYTGFEYDNGILYYYRQAFNSHDLMDILNKLPSNDASNALKALFEEGAIGALLLDKGSDVANQKGAVHHELASLGFDNPRQIIEQYLASFSESFKER